MSILGVPQWLLPGSFPGGTPVLGRGWGYPRMRYPGLGSPSQVRMGYPYTRTGVPPGTCCTWTGYAVGSMPLVVSCRRTVLFQIFLDFFHIWCEVLFHTRWDWTHVRWDWTKHWKTQKIRKSKFQFNYRWPLVTIFDQLSSCQDGSHHQKSQKWSLSLTESM